MKPDILGTDIMTLFLLARQPRRGVLGFLSDVGWGRWNYKYGNGRVPFAVNVPKKSLLASSSTAPSDFFSIFNETTVSNKLFSLSLSIPTTETMEEVGALISVMSQPTDVIFLDGDLGAGKTTWSRGFIECKLGLDDPENDADPVRVTSPTYLLSNTYAYRYDDATDDKVDAMREIHHMDLYRLPGTSPKDFEPLNLSNVFQNSISLIEWPSRLLAFPQLLPPIENVLQIDIRIVPRLEKRKMILTAIHKSCWKERLQYLADEGMLDDLLWDNNEEDDGNGNDNDSLESQ